MRFHSDACPDCDARAQLIEVVAKVYAWAIEHDETCPQLHAMEHA